MAVTWIDMLGYLASASVLATFCMRRMVPLRIMALVSNLLFLGFGALAHVYPVMILHLVLLPVNAASLLQLCRASDVPAPFPPQRGDPQEHALISNEDAVKPRRIPSDRPAAA
jgi:hypothetical protein